MTTAGSILLMAIGAILAFAVTATVSGIDLAVVGWILMAAGLLGLILSAVFWAPWSITRRQTAVRSDFNQTV